VNNNPNSFPDGFGSCLYRHCGEVLIHRPQKLGAVSEFARRSG